MSVLRWTPLLSRHVALGAKLADFGGWEMPIEYPGGGVVREHAAVRERVGVFDVSHLGKALVRGVGAADFVNASLTNDLDRIGPGQAQYTLCCNETGGVVDDLIAYVRGPEEVLLVPNAANTAEVVRRLTAAAPPAVEVTDEHETYAVIAVQGPDCDAVLAAVGLPVGQPYMGFVDTEWRGVPVIICRTGYTGERGYELLPGWAGAGDLWDALLEAATGLGGLPCGLGARDTLRTEMGYPLHGQDLSPTISPVMARAGWAVGWAKERFWGRTALLEERAAARRGIGRVAWGLLATGRGIPRAGCEVRTSDGQLRGVTTSGTFSPTLRTGIALALLDRDVAEGAELVLDVRGRELPVRVVKPPFVDVSTS